MDCPRCQNPMIQVWPVPPPHHIKWQCTCCPHNFFEAKLKNRNKIRRNNVRRKKRHTKEGRTQCAKCGSAQALEVDHIKPISLGGSKDYENTQMLCKKCHREKTRVEAQFKRNNPALYNRIKKETAP